MATSSTDAENPRTVKNESSHASSHTPTRLLATGFNAHGQLSSDGKSDILHFVPLCETYANDLRVLFAGWSQTLIVAEGGVLCLGYHQEQTKALLAERNNIALKSVIGNLNGILLTLAPSGEAHVINDNEFGDDDSPRIGHIALAQNSRVALTFQQTPTAQLCHIMEFRSYERFLGWLKDPSGEGNYPDEHHMLPGRPTQLLANTGTFVLLMEGGEVYSWGDARYGSLGRSISGEALSANKPSSVKALGGLNIIKIAASGWICAALSEDGALYVWGTTTPGKQAKINALQPDDGGDVALVELPSAQSDEPLDVLDVGIGDDHIAVVSEGNRLFVVGENSNGQLGLGHDASLADWHEVPRLDGVKAVWCGPLSTFALVHTE